MATTLVELSRIALYVNGISSLVFAGRILQIRLLRVLPSVSLIVFLNAVFGVTFAIIGSDTNLASVIWRYSSLPYAILYFLAATEIFKELYCQWPGLRTLSRRSILRWQFVGIFIAVGALTLDSPRWGSRGFDCLTLSFMEALRCTSCGLVGFILGSVRHFKRQNLELSSTTKFLTVWLISETLPTGVILWIGVMFFPYDGKFADTCNIATCLTAAVVATCSVWALKSPNLKPPTTPPAPAEPRILSLRETIDRLHAATFEKR